MLLIFNTSTGAIMSRSDVHQIIDDLSEEELELARQLLVQIQQASQVSDNGANSAEDDEDEGEEIESAAEWHFHFSLTHPEGAEIGVEMADQLMDHIGSWVEDRGLEIEGEVVALDEGESCED
jgi:hypothetical protein